MKNRFVLILGMLMFFGLSVALALISLRVQDKDETQDLRSRAALGDQSQLYIEPANSEQLPGNTTTYNVMLRAGQLFSELKFAIDLSGQDLRMTDFTLDAATFDVQPGWSDVVNQQVGDNRAEAYLINTVVPGDPSLFDGVRIATVTVEATHTAPAIGALTFDRTLEGGLPVTLLIQAGTDCNADPTGCDLLHSDIDPYQYTLGATINAVLPSATPTNTPPPTNTPTVIPSSTPTATPTNDPTATPTATATSTPTSTSTPTPTDGPNANILFRLQGVTTPSDLTDQVVTISVDGVNHSGIATLGNDGVYTLSTSRSAFTPGTYNVYIQTTQHLARRLDVTVTTEGDLDMSGESYGTILIGDTNNDNVINLFDSTQIVSYLFGKYRVDNPKNSDGTTQQVAEDLNRDGAVTIADISLVLLNFTSFTRQGDL